MNYSDDEINLEILYRVGIRIPSAAQDTFMCSCPFHKDRSPSCSIHLKEGWYHCFSCGESGSLRSMYYDIFGESIVKTLGIKGFRPRAVRSYMEDASMSYRKTPKTQVYLEEEDVVPVFADSISAEYMKRRGITPEVAEDMGIRYARKAVTKNASNLSDKSAWIRYDNRIITPIREVDHERSNSRTTIWSVLSVEGRDVLGETAFNRKRRARLKELMDEIMATNDQDRIEFLRNEFVDVKDAPYKKVLYPKMSSTSTLYQYDRLDKGKELYFVEGLMDLGVLRSDPFFSNSTAVFGATIGGRQQFLLKEFSDLVYIADHDTAGLLSIQRLKEQLGREFRYCFAPNGCKDVGDIPQKLGMTVEQARNAHWLDKEHVYKSSDFDIIYEARSAGVPADKLQMIIEKYGKKEEIVKK